MKKLESIEQFNENKLNETHLSKVMGGAQKSTATSTTAGTVCTGATNTGCMGYTSDTAHSNGDIEYHGAYESKESC